MVNIATIGIYVAIILAAIIISVVFRTPYISLFALSGILAHSLITTPLPTTPSTLFPKAADGVSWIDASSLSGVGLYSFSPNTDGNVAIWVTDVADQATAKGFKISLVESDGGSRLYLLDGTNGNANPTQVDGTTTIKVQYIDNVTRMDENSVIQIYFIPGYIGVFWIPSGTGNVSPSTGVDYTGIIPSYRHLSYEPTEVTDVLNTPIIVGAIGIETLVDPEDSNDQPSIVAPQWLNLTYSFVPSTFTLSSKNLTAPLQTSVFDPINWKLNSDGEGQLKATVVYQGDIGKHQSGLCFFASPGATVPSSDVEYVVAFIFFAQMTANPMVVTPENECKYWENETDLLSCEIRIQKHMFTKLQGPYMSISDYSPCSPKDLDVFDKTIGHGKCEVDTNNSTGKANFLYTSDCQYLGGNTLHSDISKLASDNPAFVDAIANASNDSGESTFYASVSTSSLEMGIIDSSGNRKIIASLPNPPSDVVASLKYWGIGLVPTIGKAYEDDSYEDTILTITGVTTNF